MIYKLKQNRVGRTYLGGSRIDRFTDHPFNDSGSIPHPEDWLASVTTVANENTIEGMGYTEEGFSIQEIIGDDVLPVLVKLLDSDERLVIQAHPTSQFARQHLNSAFGKTECWYFLDCAKDACVYLGFKEGVTRAKWKEAILVQDSEKLLSMLCKIPVKSGDFIFVDGGMPHAIGGGCFILELQEPSDFMVVAEKHTVSGKKLPAYRLDMNLGFDKALELYDYTTFNIKNVKKTYFTHPKVKRDETVKILSKNFTDKFQMYALCGKTHHKSNCKYSVAVITSGHGTICGKKAQKGDCFFLKSEPTIETCGNKDFTVILCE